MPWWDGDLPMLQDTTLANPRASFGLLVHHTDSLREYAYDTHPGSSGRVVVDMAKDWRVVFAPPRADDL